MIDLADRICCRCRADLASPGHRVCEICRARIRYALTRSGPRGAYTRGCRGRPYRERAVRS